MHDKKPFDLLNFLIVDGFGAGSDQGDANVVREPSITCAQLYSAWNVNQNFSRSVFREASKAKNFKGCRHLT